MRTPRLTSAVLASIAILGSGCAKTATPPGADSTVQRSNADVPQNPVNNAVGTTDNNNARTDVTPLSAARDSSRRGTQPAAQSGATHP